MNNNRALDFLNEFKDLTKTSSNEEELRSAFLVAAASKLGIRDLKLERLRQDIRRNHVIIEFKAKGLFNGTITSAKFQEACQQLITKYIPEQAQADGRSPSNYIGVCFDAKHLSFVYIESQGQSRVTDIVRFDKNSVSLLVELLDADNRIELTPENIVDDFGPSSKIADELIIQ
jgi:hypothetical protein